MPGTKERVTSWTKNKISVRQRDQNCQLFQRFERFNTVTLTAASVPFLNTGVQIFQERIRPLDGIRYGQPWSCPVYPGLKILC